MANAEDPNADSSWQQRAVDRSLSTARAKAVSRSAQILDAARDLTEETGGIDFTVQDIVDRSGLSLRSFYKHFAGKDELLLALFEELLRTFADQLRSEVDQFDDPVDRLRAYVLGFHRRAEGAGAHGGSAMGSYHVRMLELRRREFATALTPQIELLSEIVEQGIATGRFRHDLRAPELTALLTITLMSSAQMTVLDVQLAGASLEAEQLWAWCAVAVGVSLDQRANGRVATPDPVRPAAGEKKVRPKRASAPARTRST